MTNLVTGWFQLTHTRNDDTVMMIMNLEIIWITRYTEWQEIHMTTYLEFLVLSFKILHTIKYIIYVITAKPNYP